MGTVVTSAKTGVVVDGLRVGIWEGAYVDFRDGMKVDLIVG